MEKKRKKEEKIGREWKGYCHKVLDWLGLGADLFRTTHFMTLRPGDAKFNHLG